MMGLCISDEQSATDGADPVIMIFLSFSSFSTVWLVNWPSKKTSAIHTQQEYGSEAWGRFVSPTESWFLYQTTYSTQCLFLFISRNQLTASLSTTIELECYFWTICRVDLLPVKDKFVVSSDNIIQRQNHCFPCLYTPLYVRWFDSTRTQDYTRKLIQLYRFDVNVCFIHPIAMMNMEKIGVIGDCHRVTITLQWWIHSSSFYLL